MFRLPGMSGAVFDGEGPLGACPIRVWRRSGSRVIAPKGGLGWPETEAAYDRHRLSWAFPIIAISSPRARSCSTAMARSCTRLIFRKGCYVGQELTARMKHRGTARKRIVR